MRKEFLSNVTHELKTPIALIQGYAEGLKDCTTGRSDYPNQINNVIGFPYIFRGALDTQAKAINERMKIAAVHAIANIAKQPVPDVVNEAYHVNNFTFGPEYFIRLLCW